MADPFSGTATGISGPASNAAAITPNDTTDLGTVCRGIYVGGAGDLAVITAGGDTVTLTAVAVGVVYPLRVSRVLATGTTATNLVAVW
jgi:hypothetical protein